MYRLLNELFFIGACIGAAYIEKNFFKYNHSFKHWWGVAGYGLLVLICFLLFKDPILCLAAFLIAEIVFSPFLNLIRGHEFFYTSTSDTPYEDSKFDSLPLWFRVCLYFLSCVAFTTLQISFFKNGF